jgi:uncharacterized protein DUF4337
MNPEELSEQAEHAHHSGQKAIGLTTAVTAVLLAMATLMSHRAHTEEIKLQTKAVDQWNFYQAKHLRAHIYGLEAEKAEIEGHHELALEFMQGSWDEECGPSPEKGCTAPRLKKVKALQQLTAGLKKPDASPQAEQSPAQQPETRKNGSEKAASAQESSSAGEAAKKIQEEATDVDRETAVVTRRADRFDTSELFLEISIVLCSISLLAENKIYWRLSFISSAIGIAVAIYGYVLH